MTESTLGPLAGHPVVPVFVIDDGEADGDVAGALQKGGIARGIGASSRPNPAGRLASHI